MEQIKTEIYLMICELYAWLKSMYTASELKIMATGSVFGACFSFAVGGMDAQIWALVGFVIADYVTGIIAAWNTEKISSRIGFKGLFKKLGIFGAIAFAHWLDVAMGISMLRSMALFGFATVEATSLIENIDRMGYGEYIPEFLRTKLVQIREEKGVKL
ncbi:holin family protein [Sporomusa paucivorans]|uniref:phage holin family protein n=1 Tax=Sporomusa paucivorans TaxID=2376 RepID=UPI003571212B